MNTPQAIIDAAKQVEDYFRNAGKLVWALGGLQSVQQHAQEPATPEEIVAARRRCEQLDADAVQVDDNACVSRGDVVWVSAWVLVPDAKSP